MIGKICIVFGIVLIIVGIVLLVLPRIPWLGRLPGDIFIKRANFSFYFPIATCLLISVVITLLVWLFRSK